MIQADGLSAIMLNNWGKLMQLMVSNCSDSMIASFCLLTTK